MTSSMFPVAAESEFIYFIELEMSLKVRCKLLFEINILSTRV